ncbi:YihY family inner membrane protein [Pelomonas sp. CA6]|uniref:YihY family inner membrane protein n=1 Tax=Pelomonas sp. CA6 TaxID=2907999 RepID=UPI001F4C241F|nr:YihY family inner membrane protein [Pelomonas sp. CA6]MCH7344850.1 YihY family inner membrane protein [Pelomonas sp. CA6]
MNIKTSPRAEGGEPRQSWREIATAAWQAFLHWPWRQTLSTFRQRFREERLGLTAGSLTFTTLISLVPLLTVMLALFTAFPIFSSFQIALEKYFLKSLIPDNIARPVLAALTQFAAKANRLGALGLVVLGFTALMLMLTIDRTLNQIWRVQRPRPIAQRVLVYWAALTLGPLMLGGSLTLTSYAVSAGQGLVAKLPDNLVVLLSSLDLLVLWAAIAGLFRYVPNTDVRWRHALLGSAFVAVAFHVAKSLLAWYVKQVPTYSTLYGAFATVPIFLIWLYVGWSIVLLGAILAANAPALAGGLALRRPVPGLGFELALEVLRQLGEARGQGHVGLHQQALARRLRLDPLQLEPVIEDLVALDWVGRLEEGGMHRLVLLCEPAQTAAAPLLDRLLAERSTPLMPLWERSGWAGLKLDDLLRRG